MNLKKGGVRRALVALALLSEGLLAQQMPGTGSELKLDSSSGNQQSGSPIPIQSPTIVTPTPALATDKILSQTPGSAADRENVEKFVKSALIERNEFQEFVQKSLGRDLKLFGYDLFEEGPSTLRHWSACPFHRIKSSARVMRS